MQVDEASLLLAEYNGRLMAELEERKEVAQMLAAFMKQQLDKVAQAEKRLEVGLRCHQVFFQIAYQVTLVNIKCSVRSYTAA